MKELSDQKLATLARLHNPNKTSRTRLIVLAVDAKADQIEGWNSQFDFPIGSISSESEDLLRWNVFPSDHDTTVLIVQKRTAGTIHNVTQTSDQELSIRLARLATRCKAVDDGDTKRWGNLVSRYYLPKVAAKLALEKPALAVPTLATKISQKPVPQTKGISIIHARWGAFNGWIDLTDRLRSHLIDGRIDLSSLRPVLQGVKDPAFGHHKSLVVVYRYRGQVRTETIGTDLGDEASLVLPAADSTNGFALLVAGKSSDNIVRFDLDTATASIVSQLPSGSKPWSLAVSEGGEVFVGLRGKKQNIVRLQRTEDRLGLLSPINFTSGSVGRFGPGLMAFDSSGLLNVAADTDRAVHRFDPKTGKVVESLHLRAANLVGMTLLGDRLYAAEYFQQSILQFDLAADPPAGSALISKSEQLDVPHGMTVGHNGNLFVSSLRNSRIQQYNRTDGTFVGTLVDVALLGGGKVSDLHYEPGLESYFISSGDGVYRVSASGELVAKYESDSLSDPVGIAIVPGSQVPPGLLSDGQSRNGLLGYATLNEKHVPVSLRYQQGKVFDPARLHGTVTEPGVRPHNLKVVFRGWLDVPRRMNVKILMAGGSSGGGHCRLQVSDFQWGPLGDDTKKIMTEELSVGPGRHAVTWTLTGGDFGCGYLKFLDAETSQALGLEFTPADEKDVPIDRQIDVSSEDACWPIPVNWLETPDSVSQAAAESRNQKVPAELRLRAYSGSAQAPADQSKLVLQRQITIGKRFQLENGTSIIVSGVVQRSAEGELRFNGSIQHNAGSAHFDSLVTLGQAIASTGGLGSGGILPFFIKLDDPAQTTQRAVRRLRELGATVRMENERVVEVNLTNSPIGDLDMRHLVDLPSLKLLTLNGCRNLTDAGLVHLKHLRLLEGLALERTKITDAGLKNVRALTELSLISLNWTQIGDAGLAHLKDLTKLGTLYLCATKTADKGIEALRRMQQLSWLDLRETHVTDAGVKQLRRLPNLRLLCLYATPLTDASAQALAELTNVEQLTLNRTQITDAALVHLSKLPKLNDLDVRGTHVTGQGAEFFREERPECRFQYDSRSGAVPGISDLLLPPTPTRVGTY